MISISGAVSLIVLLVVGGIIFGLLALLIDKAPFMPDGWKPVCKYILIVLAVLVLIGILLSLVGGGTGPIFRP